jgi:hypothetical protein
MADNLDIASMGAGVVTAGITDILNEGKTARAVKQQVEAQKELSNYNKENQIDLFNKTGYGASMNQLMDAGLSTGLMYGKGGQGGQSNIDTQSVNVPIVESKMDRAMDIASQKAQLAVLESQANKNNVEAEVIGGVNKDKTIADTELSKVQSSIKKIEEEDLNATTWDRRGNIVTNAQKAMEELDILATNNVITKETADEQIELAKNAVISAELKNILDRQEYDKNEAEMRKWIIELEQKGQSVQNETDRIQIEKDLRTRGLDQGEIDLWIRGAGVILNSLGKIKFPDKGTTTRSFERTRNPNGSYKEVQRSSTTLPNK